MPQEKPSANGLQIKPVTTHRMVGALLSCKMSCDKTSLESYDFCLCKDGDTEFVIRSRPEGKEKPYTEMPYVYIELDAVAACADFKRLKIQNPAAAFGPCWEVVRS